MCQQKQMTSTWMKHRWVLLLQQESPKCGLNELVPIIIKIIFHYLTWISNKKIPKPRSQTSFPLLWIGEFPQPIFSPIFACFLQFKLENCKEEIICASDDVRLFVSTNLTYQISGGVLPSSWWRCGLLCAHIKSEKYSIHTNLLFKSRAIY